MSPPRDVPTTIPPNKYNQTMRTVVAFGPSCVLRSMAFRRDGLRALAQGSEPQLLACMR